MRPETKALYPDNWPEISRSVIEENNRTCEDCGRSDRTDHIVMTSHHLDYNPANVSRSNLVCLCQGCHLRRQARDLAMATKYHKVTLLIRMGQLCFQGMEPRIPKRLDRVVEGKALATSPKSGSHARPGTGQLPGPVYRVGRG